MTCPFYVASRHPCALGEPDGRHCGPRQYPQSPCNLDEIGRGDEWRSCITELTYLYLDICGAPPITVCALIDVLVAMTRGDARRYLGAVGWSP